MTEHDQVTILKTAMEKVISYNHDIAAGRINYRPHDHIQVLEEALSKVLHGGEKAARLCSRLTCFMTPRGYCPRCHG